MRRAVRPAASGRRITAIGWAACAQSYIRLACESLLNRAQRRSTARLVRRGYEAEIRLLHLIRAQGASGGPLQWQPLCLYGCSLSSQSSGTGTAARRLCADVVDTPGLSVCLAGDALWKFVRYELSTAPTSIYTAPCW